MSADLSPRALRQARFYILADAARRPCYCRSCLRVTRAEQRRARRIFRIVRRVVRAWQ